MTFAIGSHDYLRMTLIAPCPAFPAATATLARHLGIGPSEARARLDHAPSMLAEAVAAPVAKRLAALLGALGVRVRLDPALGPATGIDRARERLFDLSLQTAQPDTLPWLAENLCRNLPDLLADFGPGRAEDVAQALAGPGGLILEGLTAAVIDGVRLKLRHLQGLRVAVSDPLTALFDLLPDQRSQTPLPADLAPYLRRLGLSPCKLTGAVAGRLDRTTRDHVLARFPQAGLIAMNRDFQRFDLFLTGARNVSPREMADFLVSRSDLPRAVLERMPRPLKIETGLLRHAALRFQTDYSALGLQTCARLRLFHPIRNPSPDSVGPDARR